MIELLRFLITIIIAYLSGKLVAKMKLPSILGWLIVGMVLGPYALSIVREFKTKGPVTNISYEWF